ncbi:MAG: T9SS type A sorting domain-containing protein [Flavobacteriales bacterium]|nr:T9SS type A sorting domain-containing protein [Flavobacteriales bacterium]MCB0782948.1 T9SS type A sorting domain-containing protein [Flavobacteriales bacterium]MCB0808784.1 T9SS type A sorting domain-containing protein [Flavobacteriales bacterium]MCB0813115.1 T9SS type A sorting domain-containing protein [Flavobacteriales bacterium]MCB9180200.1 T9SS type A sorting domain-containing protein [Flavobacteriales bacterium]
MNARYVIIAAFTLSATVQLSGQSYADRIIYSRLEANHASMRLSDGAGLDTMLIDSATVPQLVMDGRYLLYLSNTLINGSANNLLSGGQWNRRTLATGNDVTLYNSTDFTQGYDLFLSDSTSAVAYACNIFNNNFDNTSVLGTITTDCNDDFPRIRQSDELIVGHNVFSSLFTVQRDGTGRTAVPNTVQYDMWPTWSPDGEWILFGRSNSTYSPADYALNVVNYFKIKQNGDSLTKLTWNAPNDMATFTGNPIWTDNGESFIAAGTLNGRYGLMEIAADGSMYADTIPTALGGPIYYLTGTPQPRLSISIKERRAAAPAILLGPNPATGQVVVLWTDAPTILQEVRIMDATGRTLQVVRGFKPAVDRLDVSDQVSGLYMVQIRTTDGATHTERLVVAGR